MDRSRPAKQARMRCMVVSMPRIQIYRDREAFEKYQASEACQTYMMEVMPMFSMTHMVENMPGNIVLSDKGIHNK